MSKSYKFMNEEYSSCQKLQLSTDIIFEHMIEELSQKREKLAEIRQIFQGDALANVDNSEELISILNSNKELSDSIDNRNISYLKKLKKQMSDNDIDKILKGIEGDFENHSDRIYMIEQNIRQFEEEDINAQIVLATIDNNLKLIDYLLQRFELKKDFINKYVEYEIESSEENHLS